MVKNLSTLGGGGGGGGGQYHGTTNWPNLADIWLGPGLRTPSGKKGVCMLEKNQCTWGFNQCACSLVLIGVHALSGKRAFNALWQKAGFNQCAPSVLISVHALWF